MSSFPVGPKIRISLCVLSVNSQQLILSNLKVHGKFLIVLKGIINWAHVSRKSCFSFSDLEMGLLSAVDVGATSARCKNCHARFAAAEVMNPECFPWMLKFSADSNCMLWVSRGCHKPSPLSSAVWQPTSGPKACLASTLAYKSLIAMLVVFASLNFRSEFLCFSRTSRACFSRVKSSLPASKPHLKVLEPAYDC